METRHKTLKIAALGDTHAHLTSQGTYRQLFTRVSRQADIFVLCGDLTQNGLPKEAENLAEDLRACGIPILAILGNHDYHSDKAGEIKKILAQAKTIFLEDETFEYKGVGFAGTKGFAGGFNNHMLGLFGEPAIKTFVSEAVNESLKLENDLRALQTKKIVVILHYSPIAATVKGEPLEIYPFLGCSRLADTIDRFDVTAVFHGHSHNGHIQGKTAKGATVYNCSYDLLKRKHHQPFVLVEI